MIQMTCDNPSQDKQVVEFKSSTTESHSKSFKTFTEAYTWASEKMKELETVGFNIVELSVRADYYPGYNAFVYGKMGGDVVYA